MLEALLRLAPGLSQAGIIYNPDNPVGAIYWSSFEEVATRSTVRPSNFPIHGIGDIQRAIKGLAEHRGSGILFPPDLTVSALRVEVSALAASYRIPAIYSNSTYVKYGGLASYGPDFPLGVFRRAASYVDRILRGEKPADLPIQQPTKYQFVINLKAAKALGLTVPSNVLALADEVIE